MKQNLIGIKSKFAIEYTFFEDSHDTELAMYINGMNILAFERNGEKFTTRWNIDELCFWLREFVDKMQEDPFPIDCSGEYAAQKADGARCFDSDDDFIFESYYQKLYDWELKHRWHSASSGAILADVYFQLVGDYVEVSWDNRDVDSRVEFEYEIGGARILKDSFCKVVNSFLKIYAEYWFR